jgi:ribosomal protein S18 acetylase RimI-like enzyme
MADLHLSRRPATAGDLPFLLQLRQATMAVHLAASGVELSEDEHIARLRYAFDVAEILLHEGTPVGMVKVQRGSDPWNIAQLQVSPEFQGRGFGAWLVREIIREASELGAGVALFVLPDNPAKRLYASLGFEVVGRSGSEDYMRRVPPRPSPG